MGEEEEMHLSSNAVNFDWSTVVVPAKKRTRSLSPTSGSTNNLSTSENVRKKTNYATSKINSVSSRDPRIQEKAGPSIITSNRFAPLESDIDSSDKINRPPPIYLKQDLKYTELCNLLTQLLGADNFKCLSTKKGITIYPASPDSYRKLTHFLRQKNAEFHTFQLQDERAFRIVIRGLHYSVEPQLISDEIKNLGFKVRSVCNVLSFKKEKLPLFFVDLEPDEKNDEIFNLQYLLYSKIRVEEPKKKRQIVQCVRCQQYGHTKRYCNMTPRCVRCAGPHESATCTKQRDTPATCALCGDPHPANYRGCSVHRSLQNRRSSAAVSRNSLSKPHLPVQPAPAITPASFPSLPTAVASNPTASRHNPSLLESNNKHRSYSRVLREPHNLPQSTEESNLLSHLSSFMSEMKSLLTPMITMMSQLLQVLISRNDK